MRYTVSIKQNRDFKRLYHRGKTAVSPYLALYCRKRNSQVNRLGITVSTKLGKAVVRNRTRRRIKEAYRLNEDKFIQGFDLIIVARTRCMRLPFAKLQNCLLGLAEQLQLVKGSAKEHRNEANSH